MTPVEFGGEGGIGVVHHFEAARNFSTSQSKGGISWDQSKINDKFDVEVKSMVSV